ncbi:futalosine hydrolase [Pseudodesulfovibrio sp. zrk46]|uniref:futalosine hydrolase n=1 Tax=Pseudodesulfovibrio sp. zrk46 TaxID=2725288 RepID=UPI001448D139|nr:futalosine hydrolase [Pseudodesulfovibrio sp. zrk46]QJB55540.1 futalosine hydrolase [Pseudodesulfovibrio sp. zrk46]
MFLITTATTKEMKAAFGHAGAPVVEQREVKEFELNGHQLLLSVTGVGLVNTALAAGKLLDTPGLKGVLNMGIAGAYDVEEFPLGTTTYAWQETWPEYGLLDEEGRVDPKAIGFAQGKVNGEMVWNRVKLNPTNDAETMGLPLGEKWWRASSISVSAVTGDAQRAGWLKTAYNADIENMEGFAIAFAAMQKGLPFLEVRTVSNLVGSRYEEDWDLKGALAGLGEATKQLFTDR